MESIGSKKRAPHVAPARYRIQVLYACVWVDDTVQDGVIWVRKCPHEEVPKAIEEAREFIRGLAEELFPPVI